MLANCVQFTYAQSINRANAQTLLQTILRPRWSHYRNLLASPEPLHCNAMQTRCAPKEPPTTPLSLTALPIAKVRTVVLLLCLAILALIRSLWVLLRLLLIWRALLL